MEEPDTLRLLFTVDEAATSLAVTGEWLRKRVQARLVPHTRIGKHIRFSDADLAAIVALYAQPALVAGG